MTNCSPQRAGSSVDLEYQQLVSEAIVRHTAAKLRQLGYMRWETQCFKDWCAWWCARDDYLVRMRRASNYEDFLEREREHERRSAGTG